MTDPKTLLQLAGADLSPARLNEACLVLIDYQNDYLDGPIAVVEPAAAIACALRLLDEARRLSAPVFHIVHKGRAGGLFDRDAARGQIVAPLAPLANEPIVEKGLPNAFANTDLDAGLRAARRKDVVIVGFMTHMCVSATTRAALDLGHRVTIVAEACATRDLPNGRGGVVPARTVHEVALVELADRFAIIAQCAGDVASRG